MPDPHETDPALTALLGDVLAADDPEAELLVRYADAPESLTAAERQQVEAHLAASPALADQLRVLHAFDPARLRRADIAPARRGPLDVVRGWFRMPVVLRWLPAGSLAAAGLLLLAPVISRQFGSPLEAPPGATRADRAGHEPAPQANEGPRAVPGSQAAVPEANLNGPPDAIGEKKDLPAVASRRELASGGNATEPPSDDVARSKGAVAAPAAPASKPAPALLVVPPLVYRAPPAAREADEGAAAASDTPRQRALVATGRDLTANQKEVRGVAPAGTQQSSGGLAARVPLAPTGLAWTTTEQPTLLWVARELPAPDVQLHLNVVDERSGRTFADVPLPTPPRVGVQRLRLADHGLRLVTGHVYRWSVVAAGGRADATTTVGWIERVEPPATVAAALTNAAPQDRPGIYAGAGFWYDALAALDDLRQRYPENRSVQDAVDALLAQGGLGALTQAARR